MSELMRRGRRVATAGRTIGNPPCYVIEREPSSTAADIYVGLDGQAKHYDLAVAIRKGVRCGHPDVDPCEMLVPGPTGRWILLVEAPGFGTEAGPSLPARELSRVAAAEWIVRNHHMLPDDLKGTAAEVKPTQSKLSPRSTRHIPRGKLDEHAAVEKKKNPSLTYEQLARILECNASTLRNRAKYPLTATVFDLIESQREQFREGGTWNHRFSTDE